MINDYQIGAFRGRKLIQRRGEVGGAKSVFVKLQGIKNELVYPTFGGRIMNPFKGAAKMFAGDLCEYRTNDKGVNPEIYILKTYKVKSTGEGVVNIERDKFKHVPFVGDKIGKVTNVATAATPLTVNAVVATKVGDADVWALSVSGTVSLSAGDVLVELGADNKSIVKKVNAVIDADIDMLDAPATSSEDDFDGARYMYTPALGGIMYKHKMSPIPTFVESLNQSKIDGWFQIQSV